MEVDQNQKSMYYYDLQYRATQYENVINVINIMTDDIHIASLRVDGWVIINVITFNLEIVIVIQL